MDKSLNLKHTRRDIRKALSALHAPLYLKQLERLVPDVRSYGVRVPLLRKEAKECLQSHPALTFQQSCQLLDQLCADKIRDEILMGVFILACFKKDLVSLDWDKLVREWLPAIDNWETCDQMATIIAAPALYRRKDKLQRLIGLTRQQNRWYRRFALSTAVGLNQKGRQDWEITLAVCARVMADSEAIVQKAMAWALRETAKTHPKEIFDFLHANKKNMGISLLRAASAKLDKAQQDRLLSGR
jgi:3-methyladenine DNA glycosylase AlkD